MGKLLDAMRTEDTVTQNGMTTNSSTLNHCVDLFSTIGAIRGTDKQRKINSFIKAFNEDALTAMKILFWARDVRGGAGERQTANDIIEYLANNHTDVMRKNIHLIPEYGRWSDVVALIGTKLENDALELISKALSSGNKLCAKWCPRGNTKDQLKKKQASAIRKHLSLSPKDYRKLIVNMSTTVEQLMCAKEWEAITYAHVPSKAMSDYMKAFGRNDYARFTAYLESLKKGETKINASALYPYDVVKNLRFGSKDGANAQWDALPNYLVNNNEIVMPMVDVSGSMTCPAGGNKNVTALDVAVSLGLYISERNVGLFKDAFLTFSAQPELQILKGTLSERFNQLSKAHWEMNTNIEAAFETMLSQAVKHKVPANEMPTMILILSDMEFDQCTSARSGWGHSDSAWNLTAIQMIEQKYVAAGYVAPKVVFWNIKSHSDKNKPVRFDKNGTSLVSGFSPSLLISLLTGKDLNPYSMMMDVINQERYSAVTI